MTKITLGADLSLTHSGLVIMNKKKVLYHGVIKSKPTGDLPVDELKRIRTIAEDIEYIVTEYDIELAVIENLAFGVRNATALTQLSGLSYFVRAILYDRDIPFILCAPTSVKKYITGSGKGDKDQMMMTIYKNYDFESLDNNEADAYALSVIGQAFLGNPVNKLLKTQEEVISLLRKQIK